MDRDPVAEARDLVRERFPAARWAVVTGSVVTAFRTAGSDLDVVVLQPDGGQPGSFRESLYWRGWPVELFVHDQPGLERSLAQDLARRQPSLHRMIAAGVPVAGGGPDLDDVQARGRSMLAAGPAPLPTEDRERLGTG